jgi:hypothetical protein
VFFVSSFLRDEQRQAGLRNPVRIHRVRVGAHRACLRAVSGWFDAHTQTRCRT